MTDLKSIEEEAADCRAAFVGVEPGAPVWCCHHEQLCENLDEPAENRIVYILIGKNKGEQARRLREFRPVKDVKRFAALYADYQAKCDPLYADYQAKCDPLDADYQAKRAALYADYQAKCDPLYADYQAKRAALYADYQAKCDPLYADYQAKCAALDADYRAKRAALYADLIAFHLEEYPDTAWNGTSIFG